MNNGKIIRKYFDFLRSYGFSLKQYNNGIDYEVIYSKSLNSIEIIYAISTSNKFGIDVIITTKGKRDNIFQCELFNINERKELNKIIANYAQNQEMQLNLFSDFIKKNLVTWFSN